MKEHIPNAELVIIEGAGHAAIVETPEKNFVKLSKNSSLPKINCKEDVKL